MQLAVQNTHNGLQHGGLKSKMYRYRRISFIFEPILMKLGIPFRIPNLNAKLKGNGVMQNQSLSVISQ